MVSLFTQQTSVQAYCVHGPMYYTPGSLPETTSLGHSFLLQITPKEILPGVQVVLKGGKDWPMEGTRQETSATRGGKMSGV